MRSANGGISKRGDNLWEVSIELPRDLETGKRRRQSKTVRGSRKKAEQVRAEMLIRQGISTDSTITVDEYFTKFYLPYVKDKCRQSTANGYESHYDNQIKPYIGSMRVSEINAIILEEVLLKQKTNSAKFEAFKLLRQMLNRAYKLDFISSNPIQKIDPPKKDEYTPEVLTKEETLIYIEHFKGTTIYPAVLVAIGAGLRRSEIVALDWRDISSDGAITIDNAITAVHGKPVDDKPKTQFSDRVVYLPKTITDKLNELRPEEENVPILIDISGERMNPDRLTKLYTRHVNKLDGSVKKVTLKNLRHSSLTLAYESGVDILSVSRRAGHSSIAITSKYYVRPNKDVDRAAASSLDTFLQAK